MNREAADMPFTTRNSALRIVGGAASAALGAESSRAEGWTITSGALIALAIVLVTFACAQLLMKPLAQAGYSRLARFAFAALIGTLAIVAVIGAFHSGATPY